MTLNEAKKQIVAELAKRGLSYAKVTGKTMYFDGSPALCIDIHGWKPDPQAQEIRLFGRSLGIVVSFHGAFIAS